MSVCVRKIKRETKKKREVACVCETEREGGGEVLGKPGWSKCKG